MIIGTEVTVYAPEPSITELKHKTLLPRTCHTIVNSATSIN